MSEIKLREDYIKLGQALKAAGSVGSGAVSYTHLSLIFLMTEPLN